VVASSATGELVALRTRNGKRTLEVALSQASRTSALSEIANIAGTPVILQRRPSSQ